MRANLFFTCCASLTLISASAQAADAPRYTKADVEALIKKIDTHIANRWKKGNVKPTVRADDAEFLRRVYLDLAGRIPSVAEVRAFLREKSADKRQKLINNLLKNKTHRYVSHFSRLWTAWMLPDTNSNFQFRFLTPGFQSWLEEKIRADVAYNEIVRELITAPLPSTGNMYFGGGGNPTPVIYYQMREFKPENLAAATSRLFLGVRLECAQCHDHPFATWSRDQFWGYAAFFSGIQPQGANPIFAAPKVDQLKHTITIPETKRTVMATFLDGQKPKWKKDDKAREVLADWIVSPKNPFFARALVNRMWEYFLGTGLLEPVDDMVGSESTSSHPELLNDLAYAFAEKGFDLKFLIEAITGSQAYQLSSRKTDPSQQDPTLFARMQLRGLTGEQLFDSLSQATGYQEQSQTVSPFAINNSSVRQRFLNRFGNQPGKQTEVETSILQALAMMNGNLTASATSLTKSQTLSSIIESPFMGTRDRVEALSLAALGRKPTPKEMSRYLRFIEARAQGTKQKKETHESEALADIFWVMLNGSEFMLNH